MTESSKAIAANRELTNLDPLKALAVLEALESKRREDKFINYWQPITQGQWDAIRAFDESKKIFAITGGNRSGKTEIGAAIVTAWALGKEAFRGEPAWEWIQNLPMPEPPNNIWVVGLDFPTLRDVIWREKLRLGKVHPGFLPRNSPEVIKKINESDFQVFFQNGSIITGKSADSGREKFQGASVDLVWIDEECEVDVFDECYQRTVDCGGRILVTLTPLIDISSGVRTPWVYNLFEESKTGRSDCKFVSLSVLDNPVVSPEEKEKLKVKWAGHPEERARLYGEFVQRSGLVYPMWDPKKHICKPFRVPQDWRRIVSIDPSSTGTTAAIWGAVSPVGDVYFYREYYERDKVISNHARDLLVMSGGEKIDMWLIDPFFGRQKNSETHRTNAQLYQNAGVPVRLANLGGDESFGVNVAREYLNATVTKNATHPRVFIFPELVFFQGEIIRYVWDTFMAGEQKGLSKEKPRKRNDHLMNAMQYLLCQRPKPGRTTAGQANLRSLGDVAINSYTGPIGHSGSWTSEGKDLEDSWNKMWGLK